MVFDYYLCLVDLLFDVGVVLFLMFFYWEMLSMVEVNGGWLECDIVEWFVDYVVIVVDCFVDWVMDWYILNELVMMML